MSARALGPIALACRAAPEGAYRMRFPAFTDERRYCITVPMSIAHIAALMDRRLNADASVQQKRSGKWVNVDCRAALASVQS